jgi:hypothetical protein
MTVNQLERQDISIDNPWGEATTAVDAAIETWREFGVGRRYTRNIASSGEINATEMVGELVAFWLPEALQTQEIVEAITYGARLMTLLDSGEHNQATLNEALLRLTVDREDPLTTMTDKGDWDSHDLMTFAQLAINEEGA